MRLEISQTGINQNIKEKYLDSGRTLDWEPLGKTSSLLNNEIPKVTNHFGNVQICAANCNPRKLKDTASRY